MRINNIGYLLKEGIRGMFQHGFMSFAAVCVTVACLVIVGSFSLLTYNVSIMVEDLNQTNEILVYIDTELSEAEAKSVGVLCIDDVGLEPTEVLDYGNAINPVIEILEQRYQRQLFTFITTNLTPKQIREKYGDRIADRFNEMMKCIVYKNPTFRQ